MGVGRTVSMISVMASFEPIEQKLEIWMHDRERMRVTIVSEFNVPPESIFRQFAAVLFGVTLTSNERVNVINLELRRADCKNVAHLGSGVFGSNPMASMNSRQFSIFL
jgi:hypothetical protein